MKTINALKTESEWSSLGLKLYLQGAIASDRLKYENSATVTYEFVSKAISIYEEDIHESKEQVLIVQLLIGTIQRLVSLGGMLIFFTRNRVSHGSFFQKKILIL